MSNDQTGVNNFSLRIILPIHGNSEGSVSAFAHAIALAQGGKGKLEIVDVRDSDQDSHEYGVRSVLEKWGMLPPNSSRDDVGKLGLSVTKIVKKGKAKEIVLHRLEKNPHDLLVIETRKRPGLMGLFGTDLSLYLADAFRQTTLYVPANAKPFVNLETGVISLKKILVPIGLEPPPDQAVADLVRLLGVLGVTNTEVFALHCGETFPHFTPDLPAGIDYHELLSPDGPVTAIPSWARDTGADLVVMATQGRNTLGKKIVGSITEQVVRFVSCPVLSVPVM